MLKVLKNKILLEKTKFGFENEGVLNPATIREGLNTFLFYRAVSKGNYSTIGFCKMEGSSTIVERNEIPLIYPQLNYETHGVEDPRIVKIDDIFYLTYTAYDGVNALGALVVSTDLLKWEKKGLIVPKICYHEFSRLAGSKGLLNNKYLRYNEHEQGLEKKGRKIFLWDKNVILFPRKINNKYYFLHRIKPDIQLVSCNDFSELTTDFWQNYFLHFNESIILTPKHEYEVSYIGGGCPPIETDVGWIIIYHGVQDSFVGYIYSACVALMDLENPHKEIARLPYPLFKPEETWELKGEVNNVCFPTGTIVIDDTLHIYYGAADERIGYVTLSISDLIKELLKYRNYDN